MTARFFPSLAQSVRPLSIAVAALAMISLTGCASKPDPTPAESAAICPPLKKAYAEDEAQFHAKSPLHKRMATEFAEAASRKMHSGERPPLRNATSTENAVHGVLAECLPHFGKDQCQRVATEYGDYNERQFNRIIKQFSNICVSRGHA